VFPGHHRTRVFPLVLALALLAACGSGTRSSNVGSAAAKAPAPAPRAAASGSTTGPGPASQRLSRYSKVLVIPEENKSYAQVIGSPDAPYINQLARRYGSATAMDAGYPVSCPSLGAYVIMTSGDAHGICDDRNPSAHPLSGGSIFEQVAGAGQQWRVYAESMPANCAARNSPEGLYLVRHAPGPYYVSEAARCARWDVPAGTASAGALHDDLAAGRLPAYGFLTPNACNDMHGANGCFDRQVKRGDDWLARWLPGILAGPDYRAGRLVVIITWDEGSRTDNHIPTLVISPTTAHLAPGAAYTHCSTLRTVEEILRLPLLGCAGTAASMLAGFGLS
jgi:phosphatidylinositol-3-phosphatase